MKIKAILFHLNQPRVCNLLLAIILLVGFILRVYKLGMADGWLYSTDVSKDILVGEHIYKYKEFTLTAPCAVGGQGLLKNSPLHYYLMAFFWCLSGSIVGVLFCGVIIGVIIIYLSFLVGKELESKVLGLIFALFFAINDMLVMFSTLTIQPFYLSFFTVLIIYLLLRFRKNTKIYFLCLAVVAMWFALNIHYSFLQLFIGFNLLILIILFWDKKLKKVKIWGLVTYGLSTLVLATLWLVTSQSYGFVYRLGNISNLMNGQTNVLGFWKEGINNIKDLFGLVFLGYYGWLENGWFVWICILMCVIFFVYLWVRNRKIRWILACFLFLLSGYLMITTITNGIIRNYFDTYVPILLMGVIYLFYRMAKINCWFGLGLLILFFLSLNSDFVRLAQKSQMTVSNLSYARLIGDKIYDDFRANFDPEGFDFSIYTANSFNNFNLGTAFYHSLEKEHGKLLKVNDYGFRWTQNKADYVVCTIDSWQYGLEKDCLDGLKRKEGRKISTVGSVAADDKFYIIYRVSDLKR